MNEKNKTAENGKETRIFEDVIIPGFLKVHCKRFEIIPMKNNRGKVVFMVRGEDIDSALQEMYSNAKIGCMDFIKEIKGLKSSIFALKGSKGS